MRPHIKLCSQSPSTLEMDSLSPNQLRTTAANRSQYWWDNLTGPSTINMGGCSSLTSLFIEDFIIQHREVEKQGRSKLHERKHRIFTLYLLDFVICHVFIGRSLSPSAEWYHTCGQARAWWRTGGGCGCWSTRCVWGPCTGQPTSSGRGSAWPSPPPSTRGTPRCSHSRGGYL